MNARDTLKRLYGKVNPKSFMVRAKSMSWEVLKDGTVVREWETPGMPARIEAERFNVQEYFKRIGEWPPDKSTGRYVPIHSISYWGPGGIYFPCQDETLARFQ